VPPTQPAIHVSEAAAPSVQLAGGHYSMPGFVWVSDDIKVRGKPYMRAGLVRAPVEEKSVAPVAGEPAAPKPAVAQRNSPTQTRQPYAQPPEPFKALIEVVMLPFDFLSYPARRDW
jgi:hypothetical protein